MIIQHILRLVTVVLLVAFTGSLCAQPGNSPTPFLSYYYDYKLANPAFTGRAGKHVISTVYSGMPSSSLKGAPQFFYGSYERNIESVKTGVGGLVMYNKIGPYTITQGSLLYSKKLPFNETSGLQLGAQALYQSSTLDGDYFDFVGDFDELKGDMKETTRSANVDLGALYYSPVITVGAAVKNLIHQDEQSAYFSFIATRQFTVANTLKINPSIFYMTDFTDNGIDLNSTFEIGKWVLLGGGYSFKIENDSRNFSFNAGVNIKDWVQVITHVYSWAHSDQSDPWVETMIRVKIPERK